MPDEIKTLKNEEHQIIREKGSPLSAILSKSLVNSGNNNKSPFEGCSNKENSSEPLRGLFGSYISVELSDKQGIKNPLSSNKKCSIRQSLLEELGDSIH
jgi:hypothetical protein